MEIQPCGPYFIGGYSFGGLVSLEMASMLEKAGHKVAFVVMIDTVRWVPVGRNNTKLILSMFDEQFPTEIHIKVRNNLMIPIFPTADQNSKFSYMCIHTYIHKYIDAYIARHRYIYRYVHVNIHKQNFA